MRISHLIFILLSSLAASCSSSDTDFPHEESLEQELMPLQGITYPIKLEVKHPFLILENMKRTDSLFHIYDLTNLELKSVFGKIGEGPDDFIQPSLFNTPFPDILISDIDKKMVYQYELNKYGKLELKSSNKANYVDGAPNAAFINDSLYVLDAMYRAPCIHKLTFRDELPLKSWTYRNPDILDYYIDPDMGYVYANENRIVFSYGYKKQIDFMDTDFNLIKRVSFDFANRTINPSSNDDVASYGTGYLGNRYFYVLFIGTSWPEYRKLSFRGTFLEVFDLDGNPVARYHLGGIPPISFAVDEDTFILYGMRDDGEPEDNLLVYKLNGLSKY